MSIALSIKKKNAQQEGEVEDDKIEKIKVPIRLAYPFQREKKQEAPNLSRYAVPKIPPAKTVNNTPNNDFESASDLFKEEAAEIPVNIPFPSGMKKREPTLLPFNSTHKTIQSIHDPEEPKTRCIFIWWAISAVLICFVLPYALFIRFSPYFTVFAISFSILIFSIALLGYFAQKSRMKLPIPPAYAAAASTETKEKIRTKEPSSLFQKEPPPSEVKVPGAFSGSTINLYRPFIPSDRATHSFQKSQYAISQETNIDQLATESLTKMGISSVAFNKYLANFKNFISKMLSKVVQKLHSEDPLIESMLAVPGYQHCRTYIIHRVKALAYSQFLAGHFGDRGDRWYDRDWTTDLPSDNQIVMHILSVWLSYFMCGKKANRVEFMFNQKYLFIKREARLENENDIILCSEDFSKFYVLTKYKSPIPERFWAFHGRDSMYAGLTLLFWFVKEKQQFLLDGADLTDTPICMDRVFSLSGNDNQ